MSDSHRAILDILRKRTTEDANPLGVPLAAMSDDEAMRHLFRNYRGGGGAPRGLHLTEEGLQLMKCYFRPYEIRTPPNHCYQTGNGRFPKVRHLVYLDKNAQLPYFCNAECVILFELGLGTKLKLADGDIQTLIEMERGARVDD